jgi:hypothetical protein
MLPVGFQPAISAVERPQTYALEGAATGSGLYYFKSLKILKVEELLLWHSAFNCSIAQTIGTTHNSLRGAVTRHAGMSCGEWGQSVACISRHISDKYIKQW